MANEDRIAELEALMAAPEFWADKDKAQELVREYQLLKDGGDPSADPHDNGSATLAVLAGAGGDDAEDFAAMLAKMYRGYAAQKGWSVKQLDETESSAGYRSVLLEVNGTGAYGRLKHEAGVHRLVRISPFNAQGKRQTSFALVEVLPKLAATDKVELKPDEIDIQFAKSGGAGGQNVNKRETAVRILHKPTNLSVHVSSERSQQANREKAMELIRAKVYAQHVAEALAAKEGRSISKTTANEWGSQIRSYVLHPYKMVKDHRTDFESGNPDKVLSGDLDGFIDAAAAQ
jgi:peptide chain release factor 2